MLSGSQGKSELGLKVEQVMASGALVTDDIIIASEGANCETGLSSGFLFDLLSADHSSGGSYGHCRCRDDVVLEIDVPDDEIVKRLSVSCPSGFGAGLSY